MQSGKFVKLPFYNPEGLLPGKLEFFSTLHRRLKYLNQIASKCFHCVGSAAEEEKMEEKIQIESKPTRNKNMEEPTRKKKIEVKNVVESKPTRKKKMEEKI